jgi:hypothetical protein
MMASPTPLKRKRSGDDMVTIEINRETLPVELALTNSDLDLLLHKDEIIEQLRLELADSKDEQDEIINQLRLDLARSESDLTYFRKELFDTHNQLSEALKKIPKPRGTYNIYKSGAEAVNQTYQMLLGKVYDEVSVNAEVTTDTFAKASLGHLDTVNQLDRMHNGLIPAFDLMMLISETCWCDRDMRYRMMGYGYSSDVFVILDAQLLGLIEQSWAETERQEGTDWAVVSLKSLKKNGDYLAEMGVDGYFTDSIDKLKGLVVEE